MRGDAWFGEGEMVNGWRLASDRRVVGVGRCWIRFGKGRMAGVGLVSQHILKI
jgi:hypothetical protein